MKHSLSDQEWNKLVESQKSIKATNAADTTLIKSYYFIFNSYENIIEYVNNTFSLLTSYPRESFDIHKLIAIIHPEDLPYFMACEKKGLDFTNTLSYGEHFRYHMSYSYRIRIEDGSYITIRQQCQAIEINSQGHLTKTFVVHEKIDDYAQRPDNDYFIFDKNKNRKLDPQNFYRLTVREREIVDLIQEGHDTRQIAERLISSKHTISTHRKNILKKTKAKNFVDLISKLNGQ
ncbi:LuxR C-terminal-related transcriptional regulator [Sphingobacterium sp. Mn56C]|uniref:LuxR C-terminal-related transcriptional regulator n=1 Tax=Sphingobacterium sp. Mn56C TaxID=3395261 RepID=UPI003BBA7F02